MKTKSNQLIHQFIYVQKIKQDEQNKLEKKYQQKKLDTIAYHHCQFTGTTGTVLFFLKT